MNENTNNNQNGVNFNTIRVDNDRTRYALLHFQGFVIVNGLWYLKYESDNGSFLAPRGLNVPNQFNTSVEPNSVVNFSADWEND